MIRKILVPVRGDGKGDNVLAHAAVLAKRFGSHVVVTHVRPRPQDMLPYGVPVPAFLREQLLSQAGELADMEEAGMKEELRQLCQSLGLIFSEDGSAGGATAAWVEEPGRQVDVIKRHGRLADLIAVAQPDRIGMLGTNSLKAALFHSGRPVLMCPPAEKVAEDLGSRVVIAWNGSLEASRAVALAFGMIEAAQSVTILTGGEEAHGSTADDLAGYLAIRSVSATIERFKPSRDIGADLLKQAAVLGDILVMGAYGESYEKEVAFGGNTRTIVEESAMPVILVH